MSEGYVDTNGVRLWYEDLGDRDGDVVVLIMGATASAISWPSDSRALTAAGHRVVGSNNRDIGLSTHIDYATDPYTLDDMAADTRGLLDALEHRPRALRRRVDGRHDLPADGAPVSGSGSLAQSADHQPGTR